MNPFHNLALVFGYLTLIFVLVQISKCRSKPFPTKSDNTHNTHSRRTA